MNVFKSEAMIPVLGVAAVIVAVAFVGPAIVYGLVWAWHWWSALPWPGN
jgi:hypothetical protein